MDVVHRLLADIGERDADGNATLGGCKVEFQNGSVSCLWMGGRTNRATEEFALRMHEETGCLIADVNCGEVIQPGQLVGMNGQTSVSPAAQAMRER